ncbi:MAG: DUF4867 family protein [Lachnospiraceae bacterium]|nr:DUF4867 family protein [Lachnospiraceae bacterium]
MNATLKKLKLANPDLRLYDVFSAKFRSYGRVLSIPGGDELIGALEKTRMPEEGNLYRASVPSLEKTGAAKLIQKTVFGGMDIQAGCCNGFGTVMNAMEYHKCAEVNVTTGGAVLLLGRPDEIRDGFFDSGKALAFYLPPRVFVEIDPKVLHFAPLSITAQGFRCLVVLEKHTNEPMETASLETDDESKLLWMRNKWLTCHPGSPQAEKGAFQGIINENLSLNRID